MAKSAKGAVVRKLYERHAGAKRELPPEGKFVAQFRNLTLDIEGDEPKARVNGVIARGEFKGRQVTKFYRFDDRTTNNGTEISGEEEFVRFMEDMSALGIDTTEVEIDEIPSVIKEDKPLAQIQVRVNGQYANVSILSPVDDDEDENDDEEEDEEDEKAPVSKSKSSMQKEEEEEEEDEDDDDDSDDDSEASAQPQKGDTCIAKPKGMRKPSLFTVKVVNVAKKTVDLVHDATGKAYPGVAWSEIEISDEDEE